MTGDDDAVSQELNLSEVTTEKQLEEALSRPLPEDVECARRVRGDILILGAGGKMGPSLVHRILRARREAGNRDRVIAVSRFSRSSEKQRLDALGAETVPLDLLDEAGLRNLPDCPNVVFMVGNKFGATGNEDLTWVMNAYVPGRIAERFRSSRIVAFSTGNVYPLVPAESGGCREEDPVGPVGEYAQSCVGRERVLQFFSRHHRTPLSILRLNYAVEFRYGVLLDIASKVYAGEPLNPTMGWVNVIWQGDANSVCFRSLEWCRSPADILNLTGAETLSVRELAEEFGRLLERTPVFEGEEGREALLNNAARCHERFGPPQVPVKEIVKGVAFWVKRGGSTLGKPTKFEVRDGRF